MTALLRCTIFNVMNNVLTFSRYFSFVSYNQHFYIYLSYWDRDYLLKSRYVYIYICACLLFTLSML